MAHKGFNGHSIRDMLAYLYERFGEASPLELEEAEKIFSRPFEETEPFGTFTKAVEETSDIAEAENAHTLQPKSWQNPSIVF